jgi:carboxyl-terminal processing protease
MVSGLTILANDTVERDVILEKKQKGEQFGFHGIGASLAPAENGVRIRNIMENGPASKTDLQAGDLIKAVDRESVTDMRLSKVVRKIRGRKGEPVLLSIERPGQGRKVIRVTRGDVVVKNN